MLTTAEYIKNSLETNLFFLRIMKEHILFASAALTLKDADMVPKLMEVKKNFEDLLDEAITLAEGTVSAKDLSAGDVVTEFTYKAELKTMEYTGLPINTEITLREIRLLSYPSNGRPADEKSVDMLNNRIITLLDATIKMQKDLLQKVLTCRMFIQLYPSMLEHVTREAEEYLQHLQMLQRREDINSGMDKAALQEAFWNDIMGDHGKFIRGMLDPTEAELIRIANGFADEFDQLAAMAREAYNNPALLPQVTRKSITSTTSIRNFKEQGTEGILACNIRSIILPLLSDHVLREANHYLKHLKKIATGV